MKGEEGRRDRRGMKGEGKEKEDGKESDSNMLTIVRRHEGGGNWLVGYWVKQFPIM